MIDFPVAETWEEVCEKLESSRPYYAGNRSYNNKMYPSYCDFSGENIVIFIGDK